jgi:hypothetical protein
MWVCFHYTSTTLEIVSTSAMSRPTLIRTEARVSTGKMWTPVLDIHGLYLTHLPFTIGWIVKDVTLFHTTAVFASTGERATMSNGSLAASRVSLCWQPTMCPRRVTNV